MNNSIVDDNKKKLIDYLPDFLKNFKELRELMRVDQLETDKLYQNLAKILDNNFISTCDIESVKRYEYLLNIKNVQFDDLETRRDRVLNRWYNHDYYTFNVLKNNLDMLFGSENYSITDEQSNYHIHIDIYITDSYKINELINIIDKYVPLAIRVTLSVVIHDSMNSYLYSCCTVTKSFHRQIS